MIRKIILASGNQGKIREFKRLFEEYDIDIAPQEEYQIPEADETGLSFIENAILKARNAAKYSGLPAIADDSGICVPALNDAPGIYSARYAGKHGDDIANNEKLLSDLANHMQRQAFFVCAIAFCAHADDPLPLTAVDSWQGEILRESKGNEGFGYDPLFYIPEFGQTAAELPIDIKNQHSHRAKALARFIQLFKAKYH